MSKNEAHPIENRPGNTYLDEENEVLHCMDGSTLDLKLCRKVFVLRTSGEWTPGWVIMTHPNNLFKVLMLEKSQCAGKVRVKCVPESYLRDRDENN